jgi:hypothetical protein
LITLELHMVDLFDFLGLTRHFNVNFP